MSAALRTLIVDHLGEYADTYDLDGLTAALERALTVGGIDPDDLAEGYRRALDSGEADPGALDALAEQFAYDLL